MPKTDKELTAEIVIAYINANQTQPAYGTHNSPSKVEHFINTTTICESIKAIHSTLQGLSNTSQPEN